MKVFRGIELGIEAVTKTFGFMGIRESGKTYAAGKLTEEMLRAGGQVVVLDPVGKWYGLRIGADGKSPGLDIPVIGGLQGDIPLQHTGGELVARTVVETGTSAVLDVSQMRKNQRKRFVTDFCETLFHLRAAKPSAMHLILEEAHVFAPERSSGQEQMLGAIEDIVRLGRNHGIGATLIDQRPQSVNKNVLNQVECLCVLRIIGSHERKAIMDWVRHAGVDIKDMADALPSLATGECMVWSPSWLRILQKTRVLKKRTYDASATPRVGAKASSVRLKDLDLGELTQAMESMVKQASESDPKVLKSELKALRVELERERAKPSGDPGAEDRAYRSGYAEAGKDAYARGYKEASAEFSAVLDNLLRRVDSASQLFRGQVEQIRRTDDDLQSMVERVKDRWQELMGKPMTPEQIDVSSGAGVVRSPVSKAMGIVKPTTVARLKEEYASSVGDAVNGLKAPHLRVINAVAWFSLLGRESVKRAQIAFIAGYSQTSGGFKNYLGMLRSQGYIDYPSPAMVSLTSKGQAVATVPEIEPASADLQREVLSRLTPVTKRGILEQLLQSYPAALERTELARSIGLSATSGGFKNYLGSLRTLGLVDYPTKGSVRAHDDLWV